MARCGRLVLPLLLGLGAAALGGATAVADEGSPCASRTASLVRQPETVGRLVGSGSRELILFVGGLASDPRDRSPFASLADRFADHAVAYFGADRDGNYETRGRIDPNGARLREAVRAKVRRDDLVSVHLVAHSMGGVVGDAAFASGLGWCDGVASYTPIDAPHRGSHLARELRDIVATGGPLAERKSELVRLLTSGLVAGGVSGREEAIADLAARRAPRAPEGVRAVVVAVPNSELVYSCESRLEGAPRWLVPVTPARRDDATPRFGAHGLALDDPLVAAIVEANVRGVHADRPWWIAAVGEVAAKGFDILRDEPVSVIGDILDAEAPGSFLMRRLELAGNWVVC